MKKKIILIAVILIIVTGLAGALLVFLKVYPTVNRPIPGEKEMSLGTGGDITPDGFHNWETDLNNEMIKMLNDIYSESYQFNLAVGESIEINLNTFEKKYKMDTSMFNNNKVKCDIYKSKASITNDSEYGMLRSSRVVCEKLN